MIKRLLAICAVLVLLLPTLSTSASIAAWERMSAWWYPEFGNEVDEYEVTMRFEPPSTCAGVFETETYLYPRPPQGGAPSVAFEPGMFLETEERIGEDGLFLFFVIYDPDPWYLMEATNVGYWRRHHQFRWRVKHFADTGDVEVWLYDCDEQELLFTAHTALNTNTAGWHIVAFNVTLEYADPDFDAYAVWEGHWTVHRDTYAYRWDRAPWDPNYVDWGHDDEEADTMEHGPVLHLYDDHPRACTGYIYWPTAASCEIKNEEPTFDGKTNLPADQYRAVMARITRPDPQRDARVAEMIVRSVERQQQQRESEGLLGPEGPPDPPPEYPKNAFLSHVFNGLEGQAHWNRIDMWWEGYY